MSAAGCFAAEMVKKPCLRVLCQDVTGIDVYKRQIHHRAGDMSRYEDARLRISSKAEVAPKVTVNGRMTTLMSFGETGDERCV